MILRAIFLLSFVGLLTSCDIGRKQHEALRVEIDSLKSELLTSQHVSATLEEIGVLLDSIDYSRNTLRAHMLEGTTYDQYVSRMADINDYVKNTEAKIRELEKSVKSSKSTAQSYASTIKKLKAEVSSTNKELIALQSQVDRYRNENDNLIHTVEMQKAEIAEKLGRVASSQDEIANLEKNIDQLLTQSKIDEAEAYFMRAQAVEMAANRTRLAPRKKRETRVEALELYRLAAVYGKAEAESKIAELEEKI